MLVAKGTDNPEDITIQHISLSASGAPTFTISAVQDAYSYYGAFAGRVRFVTDLMPDSDGNLKRVMGNDKTRFQIWDSGIKEWGPLYIGDWTFRIDYR